ncbi:hypothetical protein [Chengkuizengella axinellae]|uniref:Uncharacterized protein n=1 Tax=Chengkuizengella axinellae TaxID=3064388 RepID=A0ABT9J1T6_9BACL|nr:hypothetical protein [Chengkuizengella sp. 2205SS18-9]MDP5275458.1 hypothetical protein [Chengkuizengella sp. 2205SS18-9]
MFFQNLNEEIKEFKFDPLTPNTNVNLGQLSTDNMNPTPIAKITFDCLNPGDLVWLNGIFHVTNNSINDDGVNTIISKNGVPIYEVPFTDIDDINGDHVGQILSQQTVDFITVCQKSVTYELAASTGGDNDDIDLFGPITFTATRIAGFQQAETCQFEFDTSTAVEIPISNDINTPTMVAKLTFDCLKPGDLVWLNGLFHVDNDNDTLDKIPFLQRIFKNNDPNPIYSSNTDIEEESNDDLFQILSQQAVDVITSLQRDVMYTLIVSVPMNADEVFLSGPIAFTGTLLRKEKR